MSMQKTHNYEMKNESFVHFKNYDDLMQAYLNICNAALERNKDRFPFKQIFEAARKQDFVRKIEVQIQEYNKTYVMQIKNNSIVCGPHGECGSCQCDGKWFVSNRYLFSVVQNPKIYIQNPARLNWEWMYN